MGLDHAGAVEFRAGAGTAGDGFVVLVAGIAEGEVVHGALAAAITPSAPYKALVTQVEVSTLPATTAAGDRGFNIQSSGRINCSGLKQPCIQGNLVVHQRAKHI